MGHLLVHRYGRFVLLPFAVCLLSVWASPAELPQPTYRAKVSEVRLIFAATDKNDRAVATLAASDFAVVDKDVIVRNFQSFTRSEFTQLEISILLDASASVQRHYPQEIAQVVELISETSGVADESLSIVAFQGLQPTVLCTRRCGTFEIADLVPARQSEGTTPLYDTLIFAAGTLAQKADPQARRVVVLFSDGQDTVSKNSATDAIEALLATDVQVYAISPNSRTNGFLESLAGATGGRTFRLKEGAQSVASAVLSDFRSSYQITYKLPDRSTGFHTVRILPTRNMTLHFRCRRGYYYPAGR